MLMIHMNKLQIVASHLTPLQAHIHTGKWYILATKMMNLQPQCDIEKFICTPFANWKLTRLDLLYPPYSNLTSTPLPSITAGSGACILKHVCWLEVVVRGGLVPEGTANQIIWSCLHGTTHPTEATVTPVPKTAT